MLTICFFIQIKNNFFVSKLKKVLYKKLYGIYEYVSNSFLSLLITLNQNSGNSQIIVIASPSGTDLTFYKAR